MTMVLVTDALESHIPAIQRIYAHHVLHGLASFETDAPDVAEMLARYQKTRASGLPWWVALEGDQVLGYCYLSFYRPRYAYRYTVENSVYIRHDKTGRGAGKRLVATAIDWAEQHGYRQMVANVGDSNNLASLALHRSLGFEQMGILRAVGLKKGQWLDTVLLQRPLGVGDSTLPDGEPKKYGTTGDCH